MERGTFSFLSAALVASVQAAFSSAALAGSNDALVKKHAAANGVPEHLVHRVIRIESRGNAAAVHRGNYGLMQIRLSTARGVGYSGDAKGLLDPNTNLTYAVKYLAGAYRAAGCDADRTVKYYQRGYYGAARRECGAPSPAPAVTTAVAVDVIKPKVVRTETIAAPMSAPARPVGNFEPARVAPPPVKPVMAFHPPPAKQAMPKADTTPQLIVAEPAAKVALAFVPLPPVRPGLATTVELASIPLPPVRPEPAVAAQLVSVPLPQVRPAFDPAPKPTVQPTHRAERARTRASKKPKAMVAVRSEPDSKSKTESKFNPDDPAGVVSFLKKLVTPDKK